MGILPKDIELLPPCDERERAIFRSRRIYQADQESNRLTMERNMERTIAIEKKKAMLAVARNLMGMNLSAEQIITATGLTLEEVENLNNAN